MAILAHILLIWINQFFAIFGFDTIENQNHSSRSVGSPDWISIDMYHGNSR